MADFIEAHHEQWASVHVFVMIRLQCMELAEPLVPFVHYSLEERGDTVRPVAAEYFRTSEDNAYDWLHFELWPSECNYYEQYLRLLDICPRYNQSSL